MAKKLIIAEKPSVAADIARALGGFTREGDHYESEQYVLASAVGHLLELVAPSDLESKRGKWTFARLPVIPEVFDLRPIEKTESRLKLVLRLIKRKDVDGLVNACDAGREGELIFLYLVNYAKSKKPVQRLWLQSMTTTSIRDGFAHLRDEASMRPLANAAVCRAESDWLVGINATRAMTAFNSKTGGFYLTTVGRVQTPTLTILVEREEKIRKFVSKDYWELHATFATPKGEFRGRWFDEAFTRDKVADPDGELRAERLWDRARAEAISARCQGKPAQVFDESKPSQQYSPPLYDLTSLQREANGRFGFSARTTLSIAQALYEKHKAITYPRTDSRALPEDYLEAAGEALQALSKAGELGKHAKRVLDEEWLKPNKRIFNNAKISDHFAIIPTAVLPKALSEVEQKIYDLLAKRFVAVFFPAAEYHVTTRITRVGRDAFKTEGKVLLEPGWLAVYGRELSEGEEPALLAVDPGSLVVADAVEVLANVTKAPPRFSEATLLSTMESAGRLVDDEELREAMRAKGLGTPATRASIIEGLIAEKYIERNSKELQPTAKAFSLVRLLRGLEITELSSPELTGNWEYKLKLMEQGLLERAEFMEQITEMTRHIVERVKGFEADTVPGEFSTLATPCPKCGGTIKENYRRFACQACDFAIWKTAAGRELNPREIEELIQKRSIGPLTGFRSKAGRPFAAALRLNSELKIEFEFPNALPGASGSSAAPDFSGKSPLGSCPICKARVFEDTAAYICENAVGSARSCTFRIGKIILQRPIESEQVQKLLSTSKTDLLPRFISKKGRPFAAHLVLGVEGKVGFEFAVSERKKPKPKSEPRKPSPRTRKSAAG